MKTLLLMIGLTLAGCSKLGPNCPNEERNYHYGDKAKVIAGFYANHTGIIKSKVWLYDKISGCDIPHFTLIIEDNHLEDIEVAIPQYSLLVE